MWKTILMTPQMDKPSSIPDGFQPNQNYNVSILPPCVHISSGTVTTSILSGRRFQYQC